MISVSWVTMTGKMFRPPSEIHQFYLSASFKEMFEKSHRKIKRKGRFDVCNSPYYYNLIHLFDIAALILNGQNHFNPAMKMCKI